WAALAYHFHATGQIRYAYVIFFAFFAFDRLERVAKQAVQRRIGRNLDDFAPFDRLVRIVAGRRNVYTWLFTFFLVIGAPAIGFICLCFWGVASAVIHIFRALQIGFTVQDNVAATSTPSGKRLGLRLAVQGYLRNMMPLGGLLQPFLIPM